MRHSWLSINEFEKLESTVGPTSAILAREGHYGEGLGAAQVHVSDAPVHPYDPTKYWGYFSETD